MTLQIAAMIAGMLLLSAVGLWGLNGVQTDYGLALDGYHHLRGGYEVGTHLAMARGLLEQEPPQRDLALQEVSRAKVRFSTLQDEPDTAFAYPGKFRQEPAYVNNTERALAAAEEQLNMPSGAKPTKEFLQADNNAIGVAIERIRDYTGRIRHAVETYQRAARAKRRTTLIVMGIVCGLVVVGGVALGLAQYLGVMRPVRGLSKAVRLVAAGQFAQQVPTEGGDEFASLAADFNRMARELEGFYHQLEDKVAQKSNELIRSERLASVGYLAAGVAHEINNPLGIIAGYAEYSLEQLKQPAAGGQLDEVRTDLIKSLQVICDEAFRCKDITGKLLSLARQGEQKAQRVCLADVADRVVSIVGGLREYGDRKLTVATDSSESRQQLVVNGIEAEMQQVILNLTLNALQATEPDVGKVRIDLARRNGNVELAVEDNGRGMSRMTLDRVFEPFFTEKRGARQAGTGLGLSISHRIVELHGGKITAQSEGPGKGSRFIINLPAADGQETPA